MVFFVRKDKEMTTKYKQEDILDVTQAFIQNCLDANFIQEKMYEKTNYPLPEKISILSKREDSNHAIVDAKALEEFGETILNNNLYANINAYNLILPSVNEAGSNHSVAFMTDKKAKTIWYQDSYGIEMRKELKDFLKQLLPDYKITCFNQIQQDKSRNDCSCYLLAEYNIIDMWHRKNNRQDLLKEFTSDEAREAVWNIVKLIEAEPEKNTYKKVKNKKVNPKQNEVLSKKYLLTCQRNSYQDFKYRLTQEKNYKQIIQQAAQKAIAAHLLYKQGLIDLNLISR